MFEGSQDLPRGTLGRMIPKVLSLERMHGWGIIKRIQHLSQDVFQVNQGSLYPGLQRLKKKGWIRSEWRVTENNRRPNPRSHVLRAAEATNSGEGSLWTTSKLSWMR